MNIAKCAVLFDSKFPKYVQHKLTEAEYKDILATFLDTLKIIKEDEKKYG